MCSAIVSFLFVFLSFVGRKGDLESSVGSLVPISIEINNSYPVIFRFRYRRPLLENKFCEMKPS